MSGSLSVRQSINNSIQFNSILFVEYNSLIQCKIKILIKILKILANTIAITTNIESVKLKSGHNSKHETIGDLYFGYREVYQEAKRGKV